jgi:hypothetical protein
MDKDVEHGHGHGQGHGHRHVLLFDSWQIIDRSKSGTP